MKRILIAVAALGVAAAIAVGTQRALPRAEQDADAGRTVSGAQRPTGAGTIEAGDLQAGAPQTSDASPGGMSGAGGASLTPDAGASQADGDAAPGRPASSSDEASSDDGAHAHEASTPTADGPQARGPSAVPTAGAQGATPEAILQRAAEAYGAVRTMRAEFTMAVRNPLLRSTTNSAGTLYQQRPDKIALRFSDPAGDAIVGDGRWFWVFYPSVNADQVIRMPASQGTTGGVDLQAQFLGNPAERFDATLHEAERVGGRTTHVLTLVPRTAAGYTSLKVWLDTQDHLARRFEITEENGAVRRFELSNLRTNIAIDDDVFRFTPPAGTRVIERG